MALDLPGLAHELRSVGAVRLDFAPALGAVGERLVRDARACIAESRDPDGRPFAPLAASTLRRKRRKGYPARPLVATGGMERGIFAKVEGGTVTVDSARSYSVFHQGGTRAMPARPFLGVAGESADACAEDVADDVVKQLGF